MMTINPAGDGHFVMIPLTKGRFAIADEADAHLVLDGGEWSAGQRSGRTWYAARKKDAAREPISMHILIAGYKGVDHVNRNGLDNRRINLRPATRSQNRVNCPPSRNNTSGYKGVSWNRPARRWVARIGVNGRRIGLGYFADSAEAARAYNRAALEAFGEYAWLNPV
jgi:hypothetical protein